MEGGLYGVLGGDGEFRQFLLDNSKCERETISREKLANSNMIRTTTTKTFVKCESLEEFENSETVK